MSDAGRFTLILDDLTIAQACLKLRHIDRCPSGPWITRTTKPPGGGHRVLGGVRAIVGSDPGRSAVNSDATIMVNMTLSIAPLGIAVTA